MPITNIVIILFLLAMLYMGTVQGLFSSFLHLMVVIAAGTLAFALWETVSLSLLMNFMPLLAWTIGLLVPFGLLLLVLRMTSDKLVPGNAQFAGILNVILGGACGLFSGILTAGVVVIGLGFLPVTANLGGYQPYTIGPRGAINETGGSLWVPVHRLSANFFSALSRGSLGSSRPMAEYKPQLDVQMSLTRVRPDNVSIVCSPKAVTVTGAYIADTAALADASPELIEQLGPEFGLSGARLVIVDTDWELVKNTVDGDRALRLPPSHVRLITKATDGRDVHLLGPAGFSKPIGDGKTFYPYNSGEFMAFSTAPSSSFSFVFIVPPGQEPLFPQIRFTRLDMPQGDDVNTNPAEVLAALGRPEAPKADEPDEPDTDRASATNGGTQVGDATGIRAGSYVLGLNITNRLPQTISKNAISGINHTPGDNGALIVSGSRGQARKTTNSIGQRNKIVGFEIPDHEAMVQVKVTSDQNQSLFGAGISSAAALNPIFLEDTQGNKWFVTAWVWRKADKTQEIHFDAFQSLRSAKQMPLGQMNEGDEFYLYFSVTKPATLTRYSIGDVSSQAFEPPLQIK